MAGDMQAMHTYFVQQEQPLAAIGLKLVAFSRRIREHSDTRGAMIIANAEEIRTLCENSVALDAILDRDLAFTGEALEYILSIVNDLGDLARGSEAATS